METSTKWRVQVPLDSYLTGFPVFYHKVKKLTYKRECTFQLLQFA
jgi:hypothetical protein